MTTERRQEQAQGGAYQAEHWLAWVMVAVAATLAAIGVLRGFGMLGGGGLIEGLDQNSPLAGSLFWEAMLWLTTAVSAGFLAAALHDSDHHRISTAGVPAGERGLFGTEHLLAYLMAALTIVAGVLTLLVGFDMLDRGNTQFEGMIWGLASVVGGVLTHTLHQTGHHVMVTSEDYAFTEEGRRTGDYAPGMRGRPAPR